MRPDFFLLAGGRKIGRAGGSGADSYRDWVLLLSEAVDSAPGVFSDSMALLTALTSRDACLVRLFIRLTKDRTKAVNIKKPKHNRIFSTNTQTS